MYNEREELFKKWEQRVDELKRLNPYRNPYIYDESSYKETIKSLDWLLEELPGILVKGKEHVHSLSLRGENKDLVNYAIKLRDQANEEGQGGDIEIAHILYETSDRICRYLNGDIDELNSSDLASYEDYIGKPYNKYDRVMYINSLKLEDLYGNNLKDIRYKNLINDIFKLLKPLMINNEVSEFVICNYLGLDLIVLVVLNLFRKDGYDFKVTVIDKGLNTNITEHQIRLFNQLRHLITRIKHEDLKDEYGSLLTFRKGKIVILGGK